MQLHNRLSSLFQKETDRLLKSFLDENPDLRKKYVEGGITAVSAILGPVNSVMRHLLVVQNLDPDAVPGAKDKAAMLKALDSFFDSKHDKDFDDDYDLSWVQQKFNKTRGVLKDLKLTQDKFMELTDLSRLPNLGRVEDLTDEPIDHIAQRVNPVAPEASKRETRLTFIEEAKNLKPALEKIAEAARAVEKGAKEFNPGDAIQQLKDFVKSMESPREDKPSGLKPGKKKLNKGKRPGSGPRVHRVANTEPLKEEPSTLSVGSDRIERAPSTRIPGRNLKDLASDRKAQIQAAKEATPEFQAEAARKLVRATELTHLMAQKGLVEANDTAFNARVDSMKNWSDNNFDALERVVTKYGPTKDAVAENKFKGSFRRVKK